MKVKRMGITEILRKIRLFSDNKIKSSESISKQPTQLIVELNSSLHQELGTYVSLLTFNSEFHCSGSIKNEIKIADCYKGGYH